MGWTALLAQGAAVVRGGVERAVHLAVLNPLRSFTLQALLLALNLYFLGSSAPLRSRVPGPPAPKPAFRGATHVRSTAQTHRLCCAVDVHSESTCKPWRIQACHFISVGLPRKSQN